MSEIRQGLATGNNAMFLKKWYEVPKEEIEIIKPIIKNAMESAMNLSIPLQVEGEEGKTWYDAK